MPDFVLRYTGDGDKPLDDVERIARLPGSTIISSASPKVLLVTASEEELRALLVVMPNWILTLQRVIPIPDTRLRPGVTPLAEPHIVAPTDPYDVNQISLIPQILKPCFVDNRDGNTLYQAITRHLRSIRNQQIPVEELCISTAYFNPYGLELLASEVAHVGHIRLLLGADPTPEPMKPKRRPGDPFEPEYTKRQVNSALHRMEQGFQVDRNLLPFSADTTAAVRHLLEFLRSGKIEVRLYEKHFLHAKAFIFRGTNRGFISGSSNLTVAGLKNNIELNLGHYEEPLVQQLEKWYEELWEEADPFDLAALYDAIFEEYSPYIIYLKVLWHLYGHELESEADSSGHIPVTKFQQHGVLRALRILQDCGGVLIADGVGLGKTYIAGEIIRLYREKRQRVLLACPASLRDSSWDEFIQRYQLFVECLSYEQLANDVQLGGESQHLKRNLDEYALVVVDEAHNYRNPDAPSRAGVLRKLLFGKRRDVVLLSATPVNNSLWDLYHIIRFFLKQDAHLADKGVLSIRERFEKAMHEDPFNLNPDLLYPIIDATTVKRTRQFVKRHYEKDSIRDSEGRLVPIRFPTPIASTINYRLDEILPGFFQRFEEALMPPTGVPRLTMARYMPENYPAGKAPIGQDSAMVGLLRSGLLKRFESSIHAFCLTATKMADENEVFLQALDQGKVVNKEFLREWSAAEGDEELDEILDASINVQDAQLFNIGRLRTDVEEDLNLLRKLANEASKVTRSTDPKLTALVAELIAIAEQAYTDGLDDLDAQQKRKVLIFSYFEDTLDWIEEYLLAKIESMPELAIFKGRLASVSGQDSRRGISREKAVHGFAPMSTKAIRGQDEDLYDVLLSTDVLAEGMNLQQARNIINYDLPWNPMRLVQRHGRIDRIGSPHKDVFLRTFFPDDELNELLNLEERIRRKLAQAAASVGIETSPIVDGAVRDQTFSDTREEIEKLYRRDSSIYEAGGTASAAQSGEEYRQELREALQIYQKEIEELPWKAGTGIVKGQQRGHFFCITIGERIYLRFIPFGSDTPIAELGTCLRIIECSEHTPRFLPTDLADGVYRAWEVAKQHVLNAWQYETDPANLQPKIRKLNREIAEHLRRYPPKDVEETQLNRYLDAVEAPWSRREEKMMRDVFDGAYNSQSERSAQIIAEIDKIGLEPYQSPEPLPPILPEEIHMICWMAIEAEQDSQQ